MSSANAVEEILNFAITNEEEAIQFYTDLAKTVKRTPMKEIFEQFVSEEKGHKAKLEEVKKGKRFVPEQEKILDLKIADYIVIANTGPEMEYKDALILAMNREKKSFKLYTNLAQSTKDEDIRRLFEFLAQEEAKHKLRFEIEYDDYILSDN